MGDNLLIMYSNCLWYGVYRTRVGPFSTQPLMLCRSDTSMANVQVWEGYTDTRLNATTENRKSYFSL